MVRRKFRCMGNILNVVRDNCWKWQFLSELCISLLGQGKKAQMVTHSVLWLCMSTPSLMVSRTIRSLSGSLNSSHIKALPDELDGNIHAENPCWTKCHATRLLWTSVKRTRALHSWRTEYLMYQWKLYDMYLQCGAVMTRSIFSQILIIDSPNVSSRTSYEVYVVRLKSGLHSVTVVTCSYVK